MWTGPEMFGSIFRNFKGVKLSCFFVHDFHDLPSNRIWGRMSLMERGAY